MDQTLWQDYLKMLRTLIKTLGQLTEIERKKTEAVSTGDLNGVEECMKQEQVMSMSLRGLDQKREKMLAQMNMTSVPLRQLEQFAPASLQMETKQVAEDLRRQYGLFRAASDVARNTLECNLRAIDRLRKGMDNPPEEQQQVEFRA